MTTSSLYGSASSLSKTASSLESIDTLSIVAVVIAVCGAITLFFTVLSKRNEGKATGILAILYDTFTFKKFWLKPLLKITYLMAAIYVTIMSFGMIQLSWKLFFMMLIGGNLLLRMAYEACIMFVGIFENTGMINEKLQKSACSGDKRAPVPPQRPVQQAQPVQRPVQQPVQQPVQKPVQQPTQENQNPVQQ